MRRHVFKPIPLYHVGESEPVWTDWCAYLVGKKACLMLAEDEVHQHMAWWDKLKNWIGWEYPTDWHLFVGAIAVCKKCGRSMEEWQRNSGSCNGQRR